MADLNSIIKDILEEVDGALACAVVDLSSGLLLSVVHDVPYFTQSFLDAVAAAAVDMFRGKNVRAVESLLSGQRGAPVEKLIEEILMATANTCHFMMLVPGKPDAMVLLVTNRKIDPGMGWAALRRSAPELTALCP